MGGLSSRSDGMVRSTKPSLRRLPTVRSTVSWRTEPTSFPLGKCDGSSTACGWRASGWFIASTMCIPRPVVGKNVIGLGRAGEAGLPSGSGPVRYGGTLWGGSRTDVRQPHRVNAVYTAGRARGIRSVSGNNRDFRLPGVRSDGADRQPGGGRQSCHAPDPALVLVPEHGKIVSLPQVGG